MAGRRLDFHVLIRTFGRTPVERWHFQAVDLHHRFHITLGRFAEGCEHGAWWVTASWGVQDPLVFDTEEEARAGYRQEALRLQQMAGPGRWLHVDPH